MADAVFFFGHAVVEAAHAQIVVQIGGIHHHGFAFQTAFVFMGTFVFSQGYLHHHFAVDFGNFAVERAHAGFAGVVADNVAHRTLFNLHFAAFHAVALDLLGQQILHGDVDFFVFRVAGQTDDFHAVEQGGRNIEAVGCGDKHHIAQVVIHLGIMIDKFAVLLGIEHFQQRAGGVAAEIVAEFVDFIE